MAEHELTIGHWAVVEGSLPFFPELFRIDEVTAQQIRNRYQGPPRERFRSAPRSSVLATFADYKDAAKLKDEIAGVRGELLRRQAAAADAAHKAVAALVSKATAAATRT